MDYGTEDSVIVDMNGIDNFRFAKSLEFKDEIIRKIVKKLNILEKNKKYLRFGCSGANKIGNHPGGEVFEQMLLDSNDGSGISQSVSGYLPKGQEYSKSISLYGENNDYLREDRIVYSHTAFLKECNFKNSTSLYLNIEVEDDNISLLDLTTEITNKLGLNSYAIQIYMKSKMIHNHCTEINGRVLKHMPQKAFNVLQEATDIGLEKTFRLEENAEFYGAGTNYLRYEPEWKDFTNGHQYERRGHIHCTIIGDKNKKVHEVFHLRDAYVSKDTYIQIVINPINNIYRIYPVYKKQGIFYTKSCDKNIDNIIQEIL